MFEHEDLTEFYGTELFGAWLIFVDWRSIPWKDWCRLINA